MFSDVDAPLLTLGLIGVLLLGAIIVVVFVSSR